MLRRPTFPHPKRRSNSFKINDHWRVSKNLHEKEHEIFRFRGIKCSISKLIYNNVLFKIKFWVLTICANLFLTYMGINFHITLCMPNARLYLIFKFFLLWKVGKECFCGNYFTKTNKKDKSDCLMACKGNIKQGCGGHWRVLVYKNKNYKSGYFWH